MHEEVAKIGNTDTIIGRAPKTAKKVLVEAPFSRQEIVAFVLTAPAVSRHATMVLLAPVPLHVITSPLVL